jgi:phage shock protein PspC (stress-responsive transcriptional regulator)
MPAAAWHVWRVSTATHRQPRARHVCGGLGHQYTGSCECHQPHCVRGGSVQQRIDSCVRGVSGGLGHGFAGSCWCHQLHCVRSGSVQQRIDSCVHSMSGRLRHGYAGSCCAAGQYSNASAATCTACPAGSVTNTLAAANTTNCTACAAGQGQREGQEGRGGKGQRQAQGSAREGHHVSGVCHPSTRVSHAGHGQLPWLTQARRLPLP